MEQQNNKFYNLEEFKQFDKTGLTHLNLDLSQCYNLKDNIDILSNQLSQCSQIETLILDFEGQYLKDIDLITLIQDLPQFVSLSTLQINLIQNRIHKKGAAVLGQFLTKCLKLSNIKLDFYLNCTNSNVFTELIEAIGSLKGVQQLEIMLGNNETKDDITFPLSKTLCNLSNQLTTLIIGLSENQIGFEGGNQIGIAISNQQNLKNLELWLYKNQIGDQGVSSIATGLAYCTQLTSLVFNLYQNEVSHVGSHQIGKGLGKCSNLQKLELYLSKNKISEKGTQSITIGLKNCTLVTSMIISFNENNVGDEGALGIGLALASCSNILYLELWLQINEISDQGMESLSKHLKNCIQIKSLKFNLNHNKITDEGYQILESCLQDLPKLFSLGCWLSSFEKLLKSPEIVNCRNIKVLTLNTSFCQYFEQKFYHKRKALKIKRLVKLIIE
ncbi:hypothetical protein ABPG72_021193 [Tetrahymena utriculariae]